MRWQDYGQSSNVEDRRGMGGRGLAIGGGGIGMLILALAAMLCGVDPRQLLEGLPTETQQTQQQPGAASNSATQPADQNRQFASTVMKMTEDIWGQVLPQQARMRYQAPKLVLYSGQTPTACGYGQAAMGPFYCPGDHNLYLDFAFFQELKQEFKSPGDFAQAYVIAHEVGHHVQNLLGTMDKVQRAGQNNRLSVALELQADCYAGIWAHYAQQKGLVEVGDAEEAIRAASAVGDDTIQKRTQGYVVPDSFTHGSAQQRMQWFSKGMQSGEMRQCETMR
ncbi:MAG TPA: neutral zinc metallopeptidase [Pyrinomonadaceae bacterium]|nr:neutral zinc metallopeptidase [Pyrinomonadaceae bacterium]